MLHLLVALTIVSIKNISMASGEAIPDEYIKIIKESFTYRIFQDNILQYKSRVFLGVFFSIIEIT